MKKTIILLILTSILAALSLKSDAQPQSAQWPFYLAFEDATGAKDTLWFVLDDAATSYSLFPPYDSGMDEQFGEIPISLNDTTFQVWFLGAVEVGIDSGDAWPDVIEYGHFNVQAKPIDLSDGALGGFIFAHNFELPITLRWDSTRFANDVAISMLSGGMNNSWMSNDYLFNYDESGSFCMPQHPGELVLPPFDWFSQEHFPLWIELYIGDCHSMSVEDLNINDISVYPNPAIDFIKVEISDAVQSYQIMNLQGKTVLTSTQNDSESLTEIDVSTLSPGMYLLMIRSSKGQGMAKFLKD